MATIQIAASATHSARQASINTAVAGDTVEFLAGDHLQSGSESLLFKGGTVGNYITYTGPGVIKKSSDIGQHTQPCVRIAGAAKYWKVIDLDFVRAGIQANVAGGYVEQFEISGCKFSECAGPRGNCIESYEGMRNGVITGNEFLQTVNFVSGQRRTAENCILIYYAEELEISNNLADDVFQFAQILQNWSTSNQATRGSNVKIFRNTIQNYGRMAILLNGYGLNTGLEVYDNVIRNIKPANVNDWTSTIAINMAIIGSDAAEIHHNVVIGIGRPGVGSGDPTNEGVRAAIEVRGDNTVVADNWIGKCKNGIQVANSSGVSLERNIVCEMLSMYWGTTGVAVGYTDNAGGADANIKYVNCNDAPDPYDTPTGGTPPTAPETPTEEVFLTPEEALEDFLYLSDSMSSFTESLNGLGPVEKDKSVNTAAPGDGNTLTISSKTYSKGLGVHAYSRIRMPLNKAYSRFKAWVGVDDEGGADADIQFVVYADNVELYRSPFMTRGTPAISVDVSVLDRNELQLEVVAGTSTSSNHANWAMARLVRVAAEIDVPFTKVEYFVASQRILITLKDGTTKAFRAWKLGDLEPEIPNEPEQPPASDDLFPIPVPPQNAVYPKTITAAKAAIDAGQPTVIENLTITERLEIRDNKAPIWYRGNVATCPAGGWGPGHNIWCVGRVENVYIYDNLFTGMTGDSCIAGGGGPKSNMVQKNIIIRNNDFIDVKEPVHLFGKIGGDSRIVIAYNYFRGIRRFGVEIQEGGTRHDLAYNYYIAPAVNTDGYVYGPDVMFASMACPETEIVRAYGNISIFNSPFRWVDHDRPGYHHESGGRDYEAYNNILIGEAVAGFSVFNASGDPVKTKAKIYNNQFYSVFDGRMGWGKRVLTTYGAIVLNDWLADNTFSDTVPAILPAKPANVGRRS